MKVFVTGGNGFIGSAVVRDLARAGHDVTCLLRPKSRIDRITRVKFRPVFGDVRDLASVRQGMRGCDVTIHLAAPGGWGADDPVLLKDVIEDGTRNVLSAAAAHRQSRLILVSSAAAVNASDTPTIFDERSEFSVRDPSLAYAHAKHRAELHAFEAGDRGLPVVIVNPTEVYGPNDTALGTACNLVDFAKSTPVLVCDGGTSVVHVDDVAAGILAALDRGRPGQRYILGGENLTIRQLAQLVLELVGRRVPVVRVPNGPARMMSAAAARMRLPLPYNPHVVAYATRYWFMDSTKARQELGVEFRTARDTLADTLDWLVRAGLV